MKFRHEYKVRISRSDAEEIRRRLSKITDRSEYVTDGGSYFIKSLYFDNIYGTALREKLDGNAKREKFRIRIYNNDNSFIRLEKKSKLGELCSKESEMMTEDECQKMIRGDRSFLLRGEKPLFCELYAKMNYRLLRPVSIVAYDREPFIYSLGDVRITLDSNIRGSRAVSRFLSSDIPYLETYNGVILEVKWGSYLPDVICDAVNLKSKKISSFSKFACVRLPQIQ